MKKKYLFAGLIVLVVVLLVLFVLPRTKKSQQEIIKVGSDAAFAPFEYVDETTGELKGFDLDLMRAIGEELGIKVEIQNVAWDGIIPGLMGGNYNVIASGMTITEERLEVVNFTDPYINAGQVIVVRVNNNSILTKEDLVGKKVAVQISTTGDLEATKMLQEEDIKISEIKRFNAPPDTFLELKNGGVDAVIIDLAVAAEQIKATPGLYKMAGEPFTFEEYGFALRKSDTELLAKINKALDNLKANGKYDEIYQEYFGE
ncbi:MAG TPA: basic amino acid ABC transporter substrate-binding protein [Firmicutes bacterium]|nr:basic amino acid ABC transporter substrate-binding protein [Bacillota bacterium]HBT17540.1 basic amino acid ABC transporter substrate-binding protein [Bacillota bacterium]